jgi:hypothetical protein
MVLVLPTNPLFVSPNLKIYDLLYSFVMKVIYLDFLQLC